LGPNILSALFSNTFSLCPCFNVRDHILHQYETTVEIMVLYISVFTFLDSRREDRRSEMDLNETAWRRGFHLSSPE
jgi:hypothetical protein